MKKEALGIIMILLTANVASVSQSQNTGINNTATASVDRPNWVEWKVMVYDVHPWLGEVYAFFANPIFSLLEDDQDEDVIKISKSG